MQDYLYFIKIKGLYTKFLKLPIYYKVLTSLLVSIFIHFSFSLIIYIGLYNYINQYNIPFSVIENLNFKLLNIPLFIDVLSNLFFMILLLLVSFFLYKFHRIKVPKKERDKAISFYIRSLYRYMRKGTIYKKNWNYNDNGAYRNLFYAKIIAIIALILLVFYIFLSEFSTFFNTILTIIVPITVGTIFASKANYFDFKIFFIISIFFLILSFTKSVTSKGITNYLKKTNLGGGIPISIQIKEKIHDGYLILMTSTKLTLLDVDKKIISEFPIKSINKINYIIDTGLLSVGNENLHSPATGDSNKSKFSGESTPILLDINFTKLHN